MQEDEDPTRAQAPLGEHTGHAAVGGRREAGAHARWHGAGLRGVQRHLARRFLAVQRRRCHSHESVDKTHLDGHSNSFVWAAPVAVATMCTEQLPGYAARSATSCARSEVPTDPSTQVAGRVHVQREPHVRATGVGLTCGLSTRIGNQHADR